jgi:predicted DNA-binding transcriptional regulator YafY
MKILTTLQADKSYAVSDLSKMLGASRRTIFRDLNELQSLGIPYHYDAEAGGYVIEPDFFLPPVDLNLQEALSILMMAHKASEYMQLPFKRSAIIAALKIENNLPAKIRQCCNTVLQNISAKSSKSVAQPSKSSLDKIFAHLEDAILKKRKVQIIYNSLFDGKVIDVELSPYRLFYNHRAWYVLGHCRMHKSVRSFNLNRIKQLKTTNRHFMNCKNFNLNEYLGRAWSMIPEGRLYNIKLQFLPKVANNVAKIQWHSTQKVTFQPDGSAILEFRVDGLGEITWWIIGYGDQVQVLAPRELRKRILETAKNTVKLNQQE